MGMGARAGIVLAILAVLAAPAHAERKLAKAGRASGSKPRDKVEKATEVRPDQEGWMYGAGLGGGYAPGGAMVGVAANLAYRWPWDDAYVEAHGDFTGALSGGSLTQFLLLGARVGTPLGSTGLTGIAGLGYRRVALGMPFGDPHVYHGAAFEGALATDIDEKWRAELGIELVYPSGASNNADLVIGFGAHAQALYRFGEYALFARYELLEFHSRFQMSSTDDASHLISLGIRSVFW
jgi:hypothetical protein